MRDRERHLQLAAMPVCSGAVETEMEVEDAVVGLLDEM